MSLQRRPRSFYLDTNVIRYLFRCTSWCPEQLADVRHRLLHRSRNGSVIVLGSLAILQELASLAKKGRRHGSVMSYVWRLFGKSILADPRELLQREIRLRRPLKGSERFIEAALRRNLGEKLGDRNFMLSVSAEAREWAQRLYRERAELRDQSRARIAAALVGGDTVQGAYRKWSREHATEVDDWVRDYLRAERDHLGLGAAEEDWPNVHTIPSLWGFFAFYMARIYLVDGQNREIGKGDPMDIFHYAAAMYADVLVTDDGGLREACGAIETTPFKLQSFEGFVRETLDVRRW